MQEPGKLRTLVLLAAVAATTLIAWAGEGRAQILMAPSAGCARVNGGELNISGFGGGQESLSDTFTAGETLIFTFMGLGDVSAQFTVESEH